MYIADYGNNRIRKVTASTGIITTIAGTGSTGYSNNVVATNAALNYPFGVTVDSSGNNLTIFVLVVIVFTYPIY